MLQPSDPGWRSLRSPPADEPLRPACGLVRLASRVRQVARALAAVGLIAAPPSVAAAAPQSREEVRAHVALAAALGARLFVDPRLSPSGKVACATCHDPARAHGPPNGLAVQLAGGDLRHPGLRAVPSIRYLQAVPAFTEHFFESEEEADESVDNGASGGLTWDGRVDRGKEQARIPLLSDFEMANTSPAMVVSEALAAGYGPDIDAAGGGGAAADPDRAFATILDALAIYEQDWRTFYPYTSKYDAWLAGKATLSGAEERGLKLFEAEDKGNCASCHFSTPGLDGTPPQFTDYGMIALGLPMNPEIPANADPAWHDLGLCGPLRTDLSDVSAYCGLFRTPTLRNVATRRVFFHNGVLHDLREAVAFYATRDTDPGRWYPTLPDGTVVKFNDLPPRYMGNVNMDPPFGGRPGGQPALSDAEIDDVVAFLGTLTDGWSEPPPQR
nr:cytochrome c peroxidase [Amaricoccus macauensis]